MGCNLHKEGNPLQIYRRTWYGIREAKVTGKSGAGFGRVLSMGIAIRMVSYRLLGSKDELKCWSSFLTFGLERAYLNIRKFKSYLNLLFKRLSSRALFEDHFV